MSQMSIAGDRRTSVDTIFDDLYADIVSLRLLPGDKISEADVASRFGVSRQPVRDAFSRLENLDMLLIRPQRATEVKRFSSREIAKSRFIRASVECEIARRACDTCDAAGRGMLEEALDRQRATVEDGDYTAFAKLDYDFHRTLCDIAGVDFAYEIIAAEKAKLDRLCLLSLSKEDRMPQLVDDHERIAAAIVDGDAARAIEVVNLHLSRLDATIEAIERTNADYFDP